VTINHRSVRLLLAISVVSTFSFASGSSAGTLQSMKLLTSQIGWAATGSRLFWTTDGGVHWKDITPKTVIPENLASVFFLDTSTGWALLSTFDEAKDAPRFAFASTKDAGETWEISDFNPPINPKQYVLAGGGTLDFVDSEHGWMNLGVVSSAFAHLGILLATKDGGKTWSWAPGGSGSGDGSIRFINPKDGWTVTREGDELYVTHDGAKSWQELSLSVPGEMHSTAQPTYEVPIFTDSQHAYLPVSFSGADDPAILLVLFASRDGGKTWKRYSHLSQTTSAWATTVAGSFWMTASISNADLRLDTLTLDDMAESRITTKSRAPAAGGVWQVSFTDSSTGWLLVSGLNCASPERGCLELISTTDGGLRWDNITPTDAKDSLESATLLPSPSITKQGGYVARKGGSNRVPGSLFQSPGSHPEIRLGFDLKRVIPIKPVNDMKTWWNKSPYWDTNVYLPKSPNRGTDKNLNRGWIREVEKEGWGLWPTWFGLQAPCACDSNNGPGCTPFPHIFSYNPTTAKKQGAAEADAAIKRANALGIGHTIIYHDIENYTPDGKTGKCSTAVVAFLDGWDSELMAPPHKLFPGVYGNPLPALEDFARIPHTPDFVWIAKFDDRVTSWGLNPIPDTYWVNNQRIHQYHENLDISYGTSHKYRIDPDILDTEVDVPSKGGKTHSFNYTTIDVQGADGTVANGVSNGGTVVGGSFVATDKGNIWQGFVYVKGSITTLNYPGAFNTFLYGINNRGEIAGSYDDTSFNRHGFYYSKGQFHSIPPLGDDTFTNAYGINDDGQVIGTYEPAHGSVGAFLYTIKTGKPTIIDDGGNIGVRGINGDALMVGSSTNHGTFLYDAVSGIFTTLPYPSAALNNNLEIGVESSPYGVILYDKVTGTVSPVAYPNGFNTYISGVNDNAQIVGGYTQTSTGNYHGFLATPNQ
jgi:probable HAF family extracellular repeat protein